MSDRAEAADHGAAVRALFALMTVFFALDVLRGAFIGEKTVFLLKEVLHLSASSVTNLNLLINVPQYLQPMLAAFIDLVPIRGSRRRAYYIVGCLAGALVYLGLALLPRYDLLSVAAVLTLAVAAFQVRGIVLNAAFIAVGNASGKFRHMAAVIGILGPIYAALYGGRLGGFVTEHWSYRNAYLAGAAVSAAMALLFPMIPETVAASGPRPSADAVRAERAARWAAIRTALADRRLRPILVYVVYYGLIPGPFTAVPYFYSDALHLSKEFIGQLGAWQGLGTLIGTGLFQLIKMRGSVRLLATLTSGLVMLASGAWLTMHDANSARLAVIFFGIVMAMVGITYSWFTARACPPGEEAMIFSTLSSLGVLTYLLCDWLGTHIYDWYGPAGGHSVAFGWYVSVGANLVLTLPLFGILPFLSRHDPADGAETPSPRR